jgi:hypothetical protein
MAIIYRTTLRPAKLELLTTWLPSRPWYRGQAPDLAKAGGFRLDDPAGEVGIEFMIAVDSSCRPAGAGHPATVYHVPLTYRAQPLDGADDALIGTTEHGVLGRRWVYDGARDPVLAAQLGALLRGQAEPQAQSTNDTPDPTVLVRPVDGAPDSGTPAISRVLAAPVTPAEEFSTHEGPDGTEIRAGGLSARVRRVLRTANDDDPGPGSVSATWRVAENTLARGILVTAQEV